MKNKNLTFARKDKLHISHYQLSGIFSTSYYKNFTLSVICLVCMQDLDLTKPSIPKYGAKRMLRITTKDVLERADFRVNICSKKNLSTFITKYLIIGF